MLSGRTGSRCGEPTAAEQAGWNRLSAGSTFALARHFSAAAAVYGPSRPPAEWGLGGNKESRHGDSRVGINGFGRIGRLFTASPPSRALEAVAVNDIVPADNLAYLLKVRHHARAASNWAQARGDLGDSQYAGGSFTVNGKKTERRWSIRTGATADRQDGRLCAGVHRLFTDFERALRT